MNLPVGVNVSLDHIPEQKLSKFADDLLSLMNLSGVDMGRDTHYDSKEEMELARIKLHKSVFTIDRTIYGCLFCLPGITDFAKQKAVVALLGNPWKKDVPSLLTREQEKEIIHCLVNSLQTNRIFNLFLTLKKERINNTRTRKLILPFILNSNSLDYWSVKYRDKLRLSFEHAWNKRQTGIAKSILWKMFNNTPVTVKEEHILKSLIDVHFKTGYSLKEHNVANIAYECVSFILGNEGAYTLPLLQKFSDAKEDLTKGEGIPKEVLYGLRSTYHPDTEKSLVLELSKDTMTTKEKRLVQKSAKKAGVKVDFDPRNYPVVDLYVYSFEMGLTDDITGALKSKAKKMAQGLPFRFDHIGILVDDSQSMRGSEEQKLRPMATTLATRDLLSFAGKKSTVVMSSGRNCPVGQLIFPSGDSTFAEGLVEVLQEEPDSVFVLSDGYENAPAGRFSETLHLVREIGNNTPIYHINPVAASESKKGMRKLADEIPLMPIHKPEAIGLTLFKAMLEADPRRGITGLVHAALPVFTRRKEVAE